jgi:hypothetical protein
MRFTNIHTIDFSSWTGETEAEPFERLVKDFGHYLGPPNSSNRLEHPSTRTEPTPQTADPIGGIARPRVAARRPAVATPSTPAPDHKLALVLAFVFGAVFMAALLVLAVAIPNPTLSQLEIFRITIALAAGGGAAIIPGLLDLHLGQGARFALRAGGALAVFVVVYFYSPARWVNDKAPVASVTTIKQDTEGANSPVIVGSGNNVNVAPRTP